ncbi:MAG: hypothetical protein AAF664_22260 [Planctomycetota bacterium]
MESQSRITILFNALLILYSAGYGVTAFAFCNQARKICIQGLVLTSLVDFLRYLVFMSVSAWFVRDVWNRLFADIFELRFVAHREAITIVALLGVLIA